MRVAFDRLFFEVSYDSMTCFGREEVYERVTEAENTLRDNDKQSLEKGWFREKNIDHEVHAFVFGLFLQLAYPSMVVSDMAEAFKVEKKRAHGSWDSSDGFEDDRSRTVASGEKDIGDDTGNSHQYEGDPVTKAPRFVMDRNILRQIFLLESHIRIVYQYQVFRVSEVSFNKENLSKRKRSVKLVPVGNE